MDWTSDISLKGWIYVILDTSLEGEENCETSIEGYKVDEEGNQKKENVEKEDLVMENMSKILKS